MVCSDPRGVSTCWPLKGVLKVYHRITTTGSRLKRLFSFAYFLLLPVNGSIYSFREIWSLIKSSSSWFQIYSSIIFAFFPTCIHKIPSTPKISTPILVFQIRMSVEYHQRTFALESPHKLWYTHIRWDTHQKMYVVGACFSLNNFHFHFSTQLFDYFYDILTYCFVYHLSSIFWCEYHMVFAPITGMGRMFYFIFHLFKTSLFFRDALANHLDCSMEVLFAKAFLFTPGKTRGFFMLKATIKTAEKSKRFSHRRVWITLPDRLIHSINLS